MTERKKTISLTTPEINHLLDLILHNEAAGWYVGHERYYWERSDRIKAKLKEVLNDRH